MGQVGYDGYQTGDSTADLVPELQQRIKQLEQALDKYCHHSMIECAKWVWDSYRGVMDFDIMKPCTCGLDAARKGKA